MELPPFRSWKEGDITVVGLANDRGQPLSPETGLKGLAAQGVKKLVIDLQGVHFVGSSILGHLIVTQKEIRQAGGAVCICCPETEVMDVFRITKLDAILAVFASKDEAIKGFK